jgi:hypothetical protein
MVERQGSTEAEGENRFRVRILLMALLMALVLFIAYGLEWMEIPIDLGYGDEASKNNFYAAELFLKKHGIDAETLHGSGTLDTLPPLGDTLILASAHQGMSERRVSNLSGWVQDGGHLITVALQTVDEEDETTSDNLLERFGIRRLQGEDEDLCEDESEIDDEAVIDDGEFLEDECEVSDELEGDKDESGLGGNESDLGEDEEEEPEEIEAFGETLEGMLSGELPGCWEDEFVANVFPSNEDGLHLNASFFSYDSLESSFDQSAIVATSENGAQLLHIDVGHGHVTAVTDMELWQNDDIHCHDHAYLLTDLAGPSPKVWFIYDADVSSLLDLLIKNAPRTLLTGGLLLWLWVWGCSLRLGPDPTRKENGSRELMEHLVASADFLWRRKELAPLIDSLRDEIHLHATKHSTAYGKMTSQKKIVYLRERTGIPGPRIQEAMETECPQKGTELVRLVRTLQAMRNAL